MAPACYRQELRIGLSVPITRDRRAPHFGATYDLGIDLAKNQPIDWLPIVFRKLLSCLLLLGIINAKDARRLDQAGQEIQAGDVFCGPASYGLAAAGAP